MWCGGARVAARLPERNDPNTPQFDSRPAGLTAPGASLHPAPGRACTCARLTAADSAAFSSLRMRSSLERTNAS